MSDDVNDRTSPSWLVSDESVTNPRLSPAIVAMGGVAWLGAASMWWWIPKYGRPQP